MGGPFVVNKQFIQNDIKPVGARLPAMAACQV
jgi:hypothetical protein